MAACPFPLISLSSPNTSASRAPTANGLKVNLASVVVRRLAYVVGRESGDLGVAVELVVRKGGEGKVRGQGLWFLRVRGW